MKILVLTNEYPNENFPKSDSPWVVPYFARTWARQGHEVQVIVNSTKFPRIYYLLAHTSLASYFTKKYSVNVKNVTSNFWTKEFAFDDLGVSVINFPLLKFYPGGVFSTKALKNQKQRIVTYLMSKSFVPDVITGHWLNPQLQLISSLKDVYKCKTAFVFHSDYDKKRLTKYHAASYISGIDKLGCRSQCAANILRDNLKLPYQPFICSSGIPDEYVNIAINSGEHIFSNEQLRVLTVGRLVPVKKFDKLIEAIYMIKDIPLTSKIVGDGPMLYLLHSQIKDLDIENKVQLVGRLGRDYVQNIMRCSDVFVLIGMEVFGLVYIEAMMQGCIVVGTRGGGIDGIIIDGENGFLCNEGDSHQLSEILLNISKMSLNEKKRISNNAIFTASKYSDSLVAIKYLKNITSATLREG